jgi:copper chaperone
MNNQTFQVQGMSCGHCVRAVTEAVRQLDPQADVRVDLASGRVDVQSERERAELAQAIEGEGYRVAA